MDHEDDYPLQDATSKYCYPPREHVGPGSPPPRARNVRDGLQNGGDQGTMTRNASGGIAPSSAADKKRKKQRKKARFLEREMSDSLAPQDLPIHREHIVVEHMAHGTKTTKNNHTPRWPRHS